MLQYFEPPPPPNVNGNDSALIASSTITDFGVSVSDKNNFTLTLENFLTVPIVNKSSVPSDNQPKNAIGITLSTIEENKSTGTVYRQGYVITDVYINDPLLSLWTCLPCATGICFNIVDNTNPIQSFSNQFVNKNIKTKIEIIAKNDVTIYPGQKLAWFFRAQAKIAESPPSGLTPRVSDATNVIFTPLLDTTSTQIGWTFSINAQNFINDEYFQQILDGDSIQIGTLDTTLLLPSLDGTLNPGLLVEVDGAPGDYTTGASTTFSSDVSVNPTRLPIKLKFWVMISSDNYPASITGTVKIMKLVNNQFSGFYDTTAMFN